MFCFFALLCLLVFGVGADEHELHKLHCSHPLTLPLLRALSQIFVLCTPQLGTATITLSALRAQHNFKANIWCWSSDNCWAVAWCIHEYTDAEMTKPRSSSSTLLALTASSSCWIEYAVQVDHGTLLGGL